ncbi:MAG: hypothetical protein PHH36_05375 [Sideroxydans sp.]|nr:hypothetical protein [Sideroxydans sp.]
MRIAPSLPPPVTVEREGLEVKTSTRTKSSRTVQARTLPPMVVRHPDEPLPELEEREERRHSPNVSGERRIYCRRTRQTPVLAELRSAIDRRLHKQRRNDATEHVNEEA